MYMNLKKSTSMIILASIVVTANISMFSGYAAGPSSDVQVELDGNSGLTVGCSGSSNPRYSNELTYEEKVNLRQEAERHWGYWNLYSKASKELDEHREKRLKMCQEGERLVNQFHAETLTIRKMEESLASLCKDLLEYKTKSKKYKMKNKKLFEEQNIKFNSKCEELKSQLQIADDTLEQAKQGHFGYIQQQNTFNKLLKNKLEIGASLVNLNKQEQYNKGYKKLCDLMKEQSLFAINIFTLQCQDNKIDMDSHKKYFEFIKQLAAEESLKEIELFTSARLCNLKDLEKISKSKSNALCIKALREYVNLTDEYDKLTNKFNTTACDLKNQSISLGQAEENFEEEQDKLAIEKNREVISRHSEIISRYEKRLTEMKAMRSKDSAENANPKVEIGASISMEYDNKQCENDKLEGTKDVEKSKKPMPEPDINGSSQGAVQAKIDKSSDYNKEKKLRLKEENKKKKKNSKRGTVKAKDINYPSENGKENAGTFIKAKIIKLDKPKEDIDQKDAVITNNDGESTPPNLTEALDSSNQSDITDSDFGSEEMNNSESSSNGLEAEDEIIDNNNLEMSYKELREKLVETIKLRGPQSDDEFIEYIYDEFMKYSLSKTEN